MEFNRNEERTMSTFDVQDAENDVVDTFESFDEATAMASAMSREADETVCVFENTTRWSSARRVNVPCRRFVWTSAR